MAQSTGCDRIRQDAKLLDDDHRLNGVNISPSCGMVVRRRQLDEDESFWYWRRWWTVTPVCLCSQPAIWWSDSTSKVCAVPYQRLEWIYDAAWDCPSSASRIVLTVLFCLLYNRVFNFFGVIWRNQQLRNKPKWKKCLRSGCGSN